jgi:hypothetical protein
MFSSRLKPLRRRVGFRLSLWFVLLFLLSNAALFALTYYLLAAAIQNRERGKLPVFMRTAALALCASGSKTSHQSYRRCFSSGW